MFTQCTPGIAVNQEGALLRKQLRALNSVSPSAGESQRL